MEVNNHIKIICLLYDIYKNQSLFITITLETVIKLTAESFKKNHSTCLWRKSFKTAELIVLELLFDKLHMALAIGIV